MSIFFNLGSLILGLVSWIIPIFVAIQYKKGCKLKHFSIYSFTSCAIALVLQLFEVRNRVNIQDLSAIMDTIGAISFVSVILVSVTFILNVIATTLLNAENK